MHPRRTRIAFAATALVLAGLLGACGSKGASSSTTAASSPAAASTGGATKPTVTIPAGNPPTTLQVTDITVGTGPAAKAGDNVTVQYVGDAWSTKQQFDASWDRGQPFQFQLGTGQVIPGWDQGLIGMKVGGRRQLVIPPALGYGDQGAGSSIKPNETLVFVVDLVSIP
jgi:peptidylprolyl isomerase